jgi:hypothetical protein
MSSTAPKCSACLEDFAYSLQSPCCGFLVLFIVRLPHL